MAVAPGRLLEVFKRQCDAVPERVPEYRGELLTTVADVMAAEREHMFRATQVQQRVTEYCARLGDFIASDGVIAGVKSAKRKRD